MPKKQNKHAAAQIQKAHKHDSVHKKTEANGKAAPKHWDVAVYLAGDNNLILEAIWSLTEMHAASTELNCVNLKVQFDHGSTESYYDFSALANDRGASAIAKAYLPELLPVKTKIKESATSTSETLKSFLAQAAKDNEASLQKAARKGDTFRALVLSGHSNSDPLTFLPTNNPASALNLSELRLLLQGDNLPHDAKLDLLGLDSCTMSSIETIFELCDQARYLVSAQGYELNTGWPYRQILGALERHAPAPADAAKLIVSEYIRFYSNYAVAGVSVDMAACDLSQKPQLHDAMKELVQALLNSCEDERVEAAILVAHWRAQSYKFELYVDLWDFCYWLARSCDQPQIREACRKVQEAVDEVVILNGYSGAATQHSHGISLYFPWAVRDWMQDRESYQQLMFAFDTHWDDFLDQFLTQTQRGPRRPDERANKKGAPILWISPLEGDNAMAFKTNPNERTKTNPNERTKTNPNERTKTNPNERTKVSPDAQLKTNPNERTKTNPNERTKGNGGSGSGGSKLRPSHVKNPAELFYRYEDECVIDTDD